MTSNNNNLKHKLKKLKPSADDKSLANASEKRVIGT